MKRGKRSVVVIWFFVCLVVVGCFARKITSQAPAEELSFHLGAQTLARNALLFLWPYSEDIPPLKLHNWGSGGRPRTGVD